MGYRTYTCPVARRCGGCEWLAVPYPIQLRRKQQVVEELLGSLVEEDGGELASICGMDEPRGYRHKCASPFAPGKGGRLRCGFYASGTHRIVACERCLVEHPLGREVINAVARHAARLGIPAYREDDGSGLLRHAVVRCGWATDEALLTLVTSRRDFPRGGRLATALMREFPQLVGVVHNVNTTRGNAMLGRECHALRGRAVMRDALLGCMFEIGATTFYQTNPAQTEVLYRLALEAAGLGGVLVGCGVGMPSGRADAGGPDADGTGDESLGRATDGSVVDEAQGEAFALAAGDAPPVREEGSCHGGTGRTIRLLDAYCGCGSIGICAAVAGARQGVDVRVTGVERVGGAIASARRNAAANGVGDRCSFVRADATAHLLGLAVGGVASGPDARTSESAGSGAFSGTTANDIDLRPDVIVLDPPRAGSTPEFLSAVCSLAPERVVYVSCNVETQARDLRVLRAGGYRVERVMPVDLFPHTRHVETVALLVRA